MALTQDSLEIIRLLCDVTLRMIEGELYQLTKTGDVDITEDEHFEIIRRKTAFLFGGCAQIGGMLGGVTPGAGNSAARVRVQPRHRVPARRRPARLHGGRRGARQADWRRPPRRQGHAADHLPAAPRRRSGRRADSWRGSRSRGHDGAVAGDPPPAARAPVDRAGLRPRARVRRSRQGLPVGLPARPRARCAHGADRLRARRAIGRHHRSRHADLPASPAHHRSRRRRHHHSSGRCRGQCREQRALDGERRGGRDQGAWRRRNREGRDGAGADSAGRGRPHDRRPAARGARHSRRCDGAGPQDRRAPD